ncbi:YfhD family protein [Paenibacillus sp. 32352]|uniref:YfhD family protein n=1 Tax=Paenibacillus sp. 32352 TaxID=1969111 RepID=UPI0009AE789D|nr:YfhD family protein [Paenibacillus sp. 32352]
MMSGKKQPLQSNKKLPVAKNEDVEYNAEFADEEDLEARERAEQADARQQS